MTRLEDPIDYERGIRVLERAKPVDDEVNPMQPRRCRHRQLEHIGAVWGGGKPWPAICPACGEAVPWMAHKNPDGGWVLVAGVKAWEGPLC